MMKLRVSLGVAVCLLFVAASTYAGYDAPSWRGDDGSTYQAWEFNADANPEVPTVVDNPNGKPFAVIEDP
ncbi:MAG: hypothetical protein KAS23_07090, partial [Anaerohalosphaera sp.]|nr:hypothetical protein [Anaerohalosphaera sp.]